ncbi:MAG: N-acetylneuraminate synthase, partial [Sphingorhabdus sp.]
MKTFIIAEAGVNHNGDESLALKLVETAANCGADAVKFQTFSADKLVRPGTEKAEYQRRETGDGDQYGMLKSLEMSVDLHHRLYERCHELGIEFMSTPFDEQAAIFLKGLGMRYLKVPSGEINNLPFLEFLTRLNLPMILSTGMADLQEVVTATEFVTKIRAQVDPVHYQGEMLTVLHCTSNYPAKNSDVNLRAMQTIAETTGLPVGYSDHTLGLAVSTAAVALGATVIEKHFTLDRNMIGPDHKASLTPEELAALVLQIRAVEDALGSAIKAPTASELPVRSLVRRSVTAARDIKSGAVLDLKDLTLLRPGTGIAPGSLGSVEGRIAARNIAAWSTLQWDDLV